MPSLSCVCVSTACLLVSCTPFPRKSLPSPSPSPNAKRAQQAAVADTGALLGAPVVVRLEERVPRAEAVPVEEALHDQGRLFLLEGVARLPQKADGEPRRSQEVDGSTEERAQGGRGVALGAWRVESTVLFYYTILSSEGRRAAQNKPTMRACALHPQLELASRGRS